VGLFDFLFGKRKVNEAEAEPDPAAVWAGQSEQERARWFGEQLTSPSPHPPQSHDRPRSRRVCGDVVETADM
jgi:hypothetical protein